ncbi:MAG: chorismate mutase [Rariglobus sp.]|jgi:chorismate mutase|nr:chorismate mutase [Rariglobus sp.]
MLSIAKPVIFRVVERMYFLRGALACALIATLFAGCATRPQSPADRSELGLLMSERLALAREVARAKQHSGAPVHDPAREAAILATLTAQATGKGLPRDDAELFFTAQITASRQVQTELLAGWAKGVPVPPGPPFDLRTELRPRLDDVTRRLLDVLVRVHRSGHWDDVASKARAVLLADKFSDETIRLAIAPLDTWASKEQRNEARQRQHQRMMRLRPSPAR